MKFMMKNEGGQYTPPGHDVNVVSRSVFKGGVDVHVTAFPPRAGMAQETHPAHAHVFFLLEGCMSVLRDGILLRQLSEGDAVYIPAGEAHEIKNGTQEPMTFLAITFPEQNPVD